MQSLGTDPVVILDRLGVLEELLYGHVAHPLLLLTLLALFTLLILLVLILLSLTNIQGHI